jgi:hypothetical protein
MPACHDLERVTTKEDEMATRIAGDETSTARVNTDTARIDKLKELYRSVPMKLDFERVKIMKDSYEDTVGKQQIIRRAQFLADLLDRKTIYIDDNLFVGSLACSLNAIYTHPEWNIDWMVEEHTVEKSETEEDREANEWALEYWAKRGLKPRVWKRFSKSGMGSLWPRFTPPASSSRSMTGRPAVATSTTPWCTRKVLPA